MIKLNGIYFDNGGKKIVYDYTFDASWDKFLNREKPFFSEYDVDVSAVPLSVAVIPFLANFVPLSWILKKEIAVDEADADFIKSLSNIRQEFKKHHPQISSDDYLTVQNIVKNDIKGDRSALLFSGGVDAFASFFRHRHEIPDLITIQGADVELADKNQWNAIKEFNANEELLKTHNKHYISSNLTTFYTYHVDSLLTVYGWWGNIQHGLALISSLAPLSYISKYKKIYIASTRSNHMEFNAWGSMPETDQMISWAGLSVIHDGFELKRQDKVDLIVDAVKELGAKTTVRVCYSDVKTDLNCSVCEKCIRTIYGIVLAGGNPADFGFSANGSLYDKIRQHVKNGFKTRGTQFFWAEILQRSFNNDKFYVFADYEAEKKEIESLQGLLGAVSQGELRKPGKLKKIKVAIINMFPEIFSTYLKIRRKLV